MRMKLQSHFRQFGLLPGLKLLLLSRLKRVVYSETFILVECTSHRWESAFAMPKSISVQTLTENDSALCAEAIGREQRENESVFVAQRQGRVCGYALTQRGGRYLFGKGLSVHLPAEAAMFKGLQVKLSERGHKIGLFLNLARVQEAHAAGLRVFGLVMVENRSAMKNLQRVGFEEVARLNRISVLGRPVYRSVCAVRPAAAVPQWLKEFR